jgi:chemotaxis protein MotA
MASPSPKLARPAKLDYATLVGLVLAFGGIVLGFLEEGGGIGEILKLTPAIIVFGGTLGAMLVATPLAVLRRTARRLPSLVVDRSEPRRESIEQVVVFATKARRSGLISLEQDALELDDPYLRKALCLAVDGADLTEVRNMMELDIAVGEQEGESEARALEAAGGYAPTIGIIGAVLGLIQVMKMIDRPQEVGPGIAVAFVATIYGVGIANLLLLPAAQKVRAQVHAETLRRELLLEGVCAIVEGMNPKLIRSKLEAYVQSEPDQQRRPEPEVPVVAAGTGEETS